MIQIFGSRLHHVTDRPDGLDFSIYNDPQQYGPDVHHDRGEVLPITPERAKAVHETVWEVLQNQKTAATGG